MWETQARKVDLRSCHRELGASLLAPDFILQVRMRRPTRRERASRAAGVEDEVECRRARRHRNGSGRKGRIARN